MTQTVQIKNAGKGKRSTCVFHFTKISELRVMIISLFFNKSGSATRLTYGCLYWAIIKRYEVILEFLKFKKSLPGL